jgi:hypothetical protein
LYIQKKLQAAFAPLATFSRSALDNHNLAGHANLINKLIVNENRTPKEFPKCKPECAKPRGPKGFPHSFRHLKR